ncbi:MAG: hypothetical protein ACJ76Y_26395 [Thermoanaerobaculia bacterium]
MSEQAAVGIQEQQYATGTVGTLLSIILKGEAGVPPPGPGLTQMEGYDPAYLEVLQCGWYPSGELTGASSFRVIFMPKQAGSTEVQFTIQPRAINPLFMPVTFFVTINS